MRCWCHTVMAHWVEASAPAGAAWASREAVARWQNECERAGADCANRIEAVALRMPWARALRTGASLQLFTQIGKVELHDGDGAHGEAYRYLGMLRDSGVHLLWQRVKSEIRFLTIADDDAQRDVFTGLPFIPTVLDQGLVNATEMG